MKQSPFLCLVRLILVLVLLTQGFLLGGSKAALAAGIPPTSFVDVAGTRYQDAVGALAALGIVTGVSATTYAPNQPVTRAQLVAFVLRALDVRTGPADITRAFSDVPANHWAAKLIGRAQAMGLVTGSEGRFRPEDQVTYAEVATVLVRALGHETGDMLSNWPVGHILKAQELSLLQDTAFNAGLPAYRGEVAIMIANGVFRAPRANNGQTLSQSVYRVAADLQITPENDLLPGSTVALGLLGIDWYGKGFPASGTWRVIGGSASVTANGSLSVSGSGPITVEAALGPLRTQRVFHTLKSLQVGAASGSTGATIQMQATGIQDDNASVPVQGVKWNAAGAGTIDKDSGLLTITGAGTITVTAAWGNISNTAQIPGATNLRIAPGKATLLAGQSVSFQLLGDLPGGQTIPLTAQWSVPSGDGTVTADGQFTSGPSGAGAVVQATHGTQKVTATVYGTSSLSASPASFSLVVGDKQKLTALLVLANGTQNVTAGWTVSPPGLGTVDATGTFTAVGVGTGTLKATYNGMTAAIPVTVAGNASLVTVSLSSGSVTANGTGTVTVTARVADALGNPSRANVSQLFFSLANPALGTLSSYLVPFADGQAQATFTAGRQAGTQVINVGAPPGSGLMAGSASLILEAAVPTSVALSATPGILAADGLSQADITATLLDQTGQPLSNNTGTVAVQLAADGNGAGVLLSNIVYITAGNSAGSVRFRASAQPGTTTIRGTGFLPVQPLQIASVVVGPSARLAVRTSATSATADGNTAVTIHVDVQDAVGHPQTGDNISTILLSANGPDGTTSLGSQTVNRGTATFSMTRTVAGTYTLTASLPGNPKVSQGQSVVTFNPGAAARMDLILDPPSGVLSADNTTVAYLVARIQDAQGNSVPTAGVPITFAKLTNGRAIRPLQQTVANTDADGEAKVPILSTTTPGTEQFRASSPGLPNSTTLVVTTQSTGRAAAIRVQPLPSTTVTAGQALTVRVYVVDSAGRLVTSNSGASISLTVSGGGVTTIGPQSTRYGVATFTVTPTRVGTLTITAQTSGLLPDLMGVTSAVTAAATDHIELRSNLTAIGADGISQLVITPVAVDAGGNVTGQNLSVQLSLSNVTFGYLSSQATITGSPVTFRSTQIPGSTQVLGASTVPVVPLALETYLAGAPTAIVVDSVAPIRAGNFITGPTTVTARIIDPHGRTVTSLNSGAGGVGLAVLRVTTQGGGTSVSVNATGYALPPGVPTPEGRLYGSAAIANGVATFTFADTIAETVTLTPIAAINGILLSGVQSEVEVKPGPATTVRLTASPSLASSAVHTAVQVTATLQDSFGNPVSATGDTFTFTLSSQAYLLPAGSLTATAGANGAAITLYSRGVLGNTTITARSAATGLITAVPLNVPVDQPPATPAVTVTGINGPAVLHSDAAIKVTITASSRVSAQQLFVYLNGAQVPLYADSAGTNQVTAIPGGTSSLTCYVLQANWGGFGAKTLWAYTQNGLGTSGISNQVQFNIL